MDTSAKTAIHRKKMSAPARELFKDHFNLTNYGRILDYGCGRGTDVEEIRKFDICKVVGYDPNFFPKKPKGKFFAVLMIYVLNVIEDAQEQVDAVVDAWNYVRKGGQLVIVTRSAYDIAMARGPNWKKRGAGYITGTGTYQRGYTPKQLDDLACSLFVNARTIQYGTLRCGASFVIATKG